MSKEPAQLHEQDLEFAAQISALTRLVSQMYAHAYTGQKDQFEAFMRALQAQTVTMGIEGGNSAAQEELKARINTHLARFAASTSKKISDGPVQ